MSSSAAELPAAYSPSIATPRTDTTRALVSVRRPTAFTPTPTGVSAMP